MENLLTARDLLSPLASAVVAELVGLWLDHYLSNWRWRPLLVLLLAILWQFGAALAIGSLVTWGNAFLCLWYGFLGASVAVFGREVVLNLVGLAGSGPRSSERVTLARGVDRWV